MATTVTITTDDDELATGTWLYDRATGEFTVLASEAAPLRVGAPTTPGLLQPRRAPWWPARP